MMEIKQRDDISFEEFDRQVRAYVKAVAESGNDTPDESPDQEVLEDLQTDYYDKVIACVYERGFSLQDAKIYVRMMSQKLNEDYAITQMSKISKKYPSGDK